MYLKLSVTRLGGQDKELWKGATRISHIKMVLLLDMWGSGK